MGSEMCIRDRPRPTHIRDRDRFPFELCVRTTDSVLFSAAYNRDELLLPAVVPNRRWYSPHAGPVAPLWPLRHPENPTEHGGRQTTILLFAHDNNTLTQSVAFSQRLSESGPVSL